MQQQVAPRTFDSFQEANQWLGATFGGWADELSAEEYEAVRYYASPAYNSLNLALRSRRPLSGVQERHVAALDRALRVPLPEPVIAYRGVELARPTHFNTRVGRPLVFRGYVSTTLLRPIAEGFCALARTSQHAVLFETVLPAGTLVGCPDLVQPTLEAELLLPRRQPFELGEALAPEAGRRYWTVKMRASPRPLLEQPRAAAQYSAEQDLSASPGAARRNAARWESRRANWPSIPPPKGPSIGH